jgi:hypothetical protein
MTSQIKTEGEGERHMKTIRGNILKGICLTMVLSGVLAAQMPRTNTERVKGAMSTATQELTGTVIAVEGNTFVAKMSNGELRTFTPPPERRFIIDGQELTLSQLKVGTKLKGTVTTTSTSVTERTTTVGSGKVWFVSVPNVILTLPNGENRQYKVADDYKFVVDGKPATVFDLRKGMTVRAEKIVEVPKTEFATNVRITGTAPVEAKREVAQAAAPAPARAPAPRPAPVAEPEPAPAPAPVEQDAPAPAQLPRTASPLPLIGLAGLLCGVASLCLRRYR